MRTQRQRNSLIANREDQPHYRQRARDAAFGIYRPLTIESQSEVQHVMHAAAKKVGTFLLDNRGDAAALRVPHEMGVTFLEFGKVRNCLRSGMLQRGMNIGAVLDLGRELERIERGVTSAPPTLEVPLYGMKWLGKGGRKLASGLLEDSVASHELEYQAIAIEELLDSANASQLDVAVPDHLALLQYGKIGDGQTLSARHQKEIKLIVRDQMRESGLGNIMLGGAVVGRGYNDTF